MTENQKVQKAANAIARGHGYGRADEIVWGDEDTVVNHIRYGYRKKRQENMYRMLIEISLVGRIRIINTPILLSCSLSNDVEVPDDPSLCVVQN